MGRRVVITGLGTVAPTGIGTEAFWNACKEGTVGIGPITAFDASAFKAKLAAEVKGFDPKKYMDPKSARRMERFSQFAVAAAVEAMEDAGIDMEQEDPYRAGCAIGSGVGSLMLTEKETRRLDAKGPGMVSPLFIPLMISRSSPGASPRKIGLGKSGKRKLDITVDSSFGVRLRRVIFPSTSS